jgi:hypothetical protein
MFAVGQAAVQVEQAKQADSSSPFGMLLISSRNLESSFDISIASISVTGGPVGSSISVMGYTTGC